MPSTPNVLRWNGSSGHYEVYYLTLTDPGTGVGVWIRYTMIAPLARTGAPSSAALWFLVMDPRAPACGRFGRKASFPIASLSSETEPFALRIGDATLTDRSMAGGLPDVEWDLHWSPGRAYEHVHPLLRRIASTNLVLPHADVAIEGTITYAGRRIDVRGARGAQAHLWGTKHAGSWAWVHCNDFATPSGEPVRDTFIDGVSVMVPRFGREVGPSTPFVGRIDGRDFTSRTPLRVLSNSSRFSPDGWRFEVVDGARRLVGEVQAERGALAGVTYHDPDGELAYCYNSETCSMRLHLYERSRAVRGWVHRLTLEAPGRAHFEYAQRTPLADLELLTR